MKIRGNDESIQKVVETEQERKTEAESERQFRSLRGYLADDPAEHQGSIALLTIYDKQDTATINLNIINKISQDMGGDNHRE